MFADIHKIKVSTASKLKEMREKKHESEDKEKQQKNRARVKWEQ